MTDILSPKLKYGILFFDENLEEKKNIKANLMEGYSCLNGQVSRFSSISELPKNVIWLSNLDKYNVWRTGEFDYIKDKNYLGIPFKTLYQNFFMDKELKSALKQMEKMFQVTMESIERYCYESKRDIKAFYKGNLAEVLFDYFVNDLFVHFEDSVRDVKLSEKTAFELLTSRKQVFANNSGEKQGEQEDNEFLEELTDFSYGKGKYELSEKEKLDLIKLKAGFEKAYIESIKIDSSRLLENQQFSFLVESSFYLNKMLSTEIPVGRWRRVELSEFLNTGTSVEAFVKNIVGKVKTKNEDAAILFHIDNIVLDRSLSGSGVDLPTLFLGMRGSLLNGSIIEDLWLTKEEVEEFSKLASFEIVDVFVNDETKQLKQLFRQFVFLPTLFNQTELTQHSLVYAIALRVFLQCFITRVYSAKNRERQPVNELMLWFLAADRRICYEIAQELGELGLIVYSYGGGEVVTAIEKSQQINLEKLIEICLDNKVYIPISLISKVVNSSTEKTFVKLLLDSNAIENHRLDAFLKYKNLKNVKNELFYIEFGNEVGAVDFRKNSSETLVKMLSKLNIEQEDEEALMISSWLEKVSKILSS